MPDIERVEKVVEEIKERRKRLKSIEHLRYLLTSSYEREKFRWYDRLLWGKQRTYSTEEAKPVITREEAELFVEWLREIEQPRVEKIISDLESSVGLLDTSQDTD